MEQKVYTFAKLHSFKKAEEHVTELLRRVLGQTGVIIENFTTPSKVKDVHFVAMTAVVVIDARQTRTLITPERRDPNVDHWNELDMLTSKVTKPPGSVLIIIYGDEKSEDLAEGLITNNWLTIWKFNDVNAYSWAQRGLILSIYNKFNETQEERIRDFFDIVPLLPENNLRMNTLLLGCKEGRAGVYACMNKHPFLELNKEQQETLPYNTVYRYRGFNEPQKRAPSICIIYDDHIGPVKICENDNILDEFISSGILAGHKIINYKSRYWCSPCCSKDTVEVPSIDRALLIVHCKVCFQLICDDRNRIADYIRTELGKNSIDFHGDVLPLLSNQDASSESVITASQLVINDLKKLSHENHLEEKERRLTNASSERVSMMYTYHAFQSPPIRSHALVGIDQDNDQSSSGECVKITIATVLIILLVCGVAVVLSLKFWFKLL
ncbi:uncharacterized protein LOC144444963 [Glandiceps talaboti]